jgi:hypothetical protein
MNNIKYRLKINVRIYLLRYENLNNLINETVLLFAFSIAIDYFMHMHTSFLIELIEGFLR